VFSPSDTIVAIATPPGRGGLGIVRLSGPDSARIASALARRERFEPRRATLTRLASIDAVVVTWFPAPCSYTGQDVVELSAHGSPVVLRAIVTAALSEGARLAEPGEFTLRAFLNGRIDLPQAEAVADLIDAVTPAQARAAFDQLQGTLSRAIGEIDGALFDLIARLEASVDFPEEGYHFAEPREVMGTLEQLVQRTERLVAGARRGRLVREGLQVAIIGKPNVGKSSLFNALAGAPRAIVAAAAGTTRDLVTERVDLDGLCATLVDTAGLRDAMDEIEAEGVWRARGASQVADLVIAVLDASQPLDEDDHQVVAHATRRRHLVAVNKTDLPAAWSAADLRCDASRSSPVVRISAATGAGLDELRAAVSAALDAEPTSDGPAITNVRHLALVEQARAALTRALAAVREAGGALSEEFVLADLQDARAALEEVTGRRTSDDLLARIFERFCVGK
jgi:tRNA modification GTPase